MKTFIKNKSKTAQAEYDECIFVVHYTAHQEEPRTYDYPGYPRHIEVDKITLASGDQDECLLGCLSDYVVEDLEQQIYDYEFDV